MLPVRAAPLLFVLLPYPLLGVGMEKKSIHPNVVFDKSLKNHVLMSGEKIVAVVNPLKKPLERANLANTRIHDDVKSCRAGELLLLHEGLVVAKVIPTTPGLLQRLREK